MSGIPYEIVHFKVKANNVTRTRKGYQIGKYILVGLATEFEDQNNPRFAIFNSVTMSTVIPNLFLNVNDAIKMAEVLRDVYGDYWEIPTVWDNFDVLRCAQWSDGPRSRGAVALYLALQEVKESGIITVTEIQQRFYANRPKAEELIKSYVHVT